MLSKSHSVRPRPPKIAKKRDNRLIITERRKNTERFSTKDIQQRNQTCHDLSGFGLKLANFNYMVLWTYQRRYVLNNQIVSALA